MPREEIEMKGSLPYRIKLGEIVSFILFLFLGNTSVLWAYSMGGEKESLEGLKGVFLMAPNLTISSGDILGIPREEISDVVHLQFRIAGVKIFGSENIEEWTGREAGRISYLKTNILGGEIADDAGDPLGQENRFVYVISIQLLQSVFLASNGRPPKRPLWSFQAYTWQHQKIFFSNRQGIRDNLKIMVNRFINDFLEMNPKAEL